ncbi:sigma-70 family RNA polymerase sigma factor [Svornostia abyssi]|uniref:Sigma-70 family RNA polymerase sigma factor n=1 Tax=Svornostia abyssi TaxID=2898438 RepID=A0ABY5PLC2_9ACTN|nr:sigma-70 family RNA polymerase sigma factor [Parviterribacteraceae bacterium J379]
MDDLATIAALRAGDEAVFAELVRRYQPMMLRVARMYVKTPGAAEEVVQETWLGVLRGLDRFEGRSSVKTWIFRILVNQAKTRGVRDQRVTPFASLEGDDGGAAVDPSRFEPGGWWAAHPGAWTQLPAERLESKETIAAVRDAIAELPARQQEVIVLRDLVGLDGAEVSENLGITEGNQRVLLHRARAKVRAALEGELT